MPTHSDEGTASRRSVWLFMAATAMATTVATLTATAMAGSGASEPTAVTCTCETPAPSVVAVAPPTPPPSEPACDSAVEVTPPRIPSVQLDADPPSPSATIEGGLDKKIIRRIVRAHVNEVRYCYNQGLTRDPDLGGRVMVSFIIEGNGEVGNSTVASSTLGDTEVSECIAEAVARWKFPKSPEGQNVRITYPFVLEPG